MSPSSVSHMVQFESEDSRFALWSGGSLGFSKVAIRTWIFLEALMVSNPGFQMGPNLSKLLVKITLNTPKPNSVHLVWKSEVC